MAIPRNRATGDQHLVGAAAATQACQLQQRVEARCSRLLQYDFDPWWGDQGCRQVEEQESKRIPFVNQQLDVAL